VSECRNKSLQQMFLMIGGGERAGSGADKIRSGWRAQHWRAPQIRTQMEPDRVILYLPMVSLIPDETLERLRRTFGTQVDALSPAEIQALATADLEGAVSNARLQDLLTDHPVDITRLLQGLCERGFLVSDNRRRWTTYRLGEGAGPESAARDSAHWRGDSAHSEGDSAHSEGDSAHLTEADLLRSIASPVAEKGKASATEVRETLLRLCQGRYLTAEELARLLQRTAPNLRNRYLSPMVAEGLLHMRYPQTPNRPDQAYTSASGNP
jgi:ATP-dependent DNA helicase RecG